MTCKPIKYHPLQAYFSSGRLLHLITLVELAIISVLMPDLITTDTGSNLFFAALKYYGVIFLVSLPLLSQLDARSRYQNYKKIKDQFYLHGFDPRILRPGLNSRCQRDAALVAAKQVGVQDDCRKYFMAAGYRWYHLFPDFVFQKPQFLLTKTFWQTTFFAPTYTPRFH